MYVKIVEKGCPICEGEVRGNRRNMFFCPSCNILFRSSQLNPEGKFKGMITDNNKILKRFEND